MIPPNAKNIQNFFFIQLPKDPVFGTLVFKFFFEGITRYQMEHQNFSKIF
jgi:hypothetical protein